MVCNNRKKPLEPVIIALDQKAHYEALIVSFLTEHPIPFTAAPSLIQLTQEIGEDAKILPELKMGRAKASYKLACENETQYIQNKFPVKKQRAKTPLLYRTSMS